MKPISQPNTDEDKLDRTTSIVRTTSTSIETAEPFMLSVAENLIGQNQSDVLLEKIVEHHQQLSKNNEIVIVEGLIPTRKHSYANSINYEIAQALDAEIILVSAPATETPTQLKERVEAAASMFGGLQLFDHQSISILEIGFGTGLNALATYSCFARKSASTTRIQALITKDASCPQHYPRRISHR